MLLNFYSIFLFKRKISNFKAKIPVTMVLQLNGRAKEPFSLDGSVFAGAEDRLDHNLKTDLNWSL